MRQTAKVTATGSFGGEPNVVEVIRYENEPGEGEPYLLEVIKNGIVLDGPNYKPTESSIEDFWYLYTLRERIKEVYLEQGGSPHFYDPEHYFYSTKYEVEYNPKPNTIEAYWFAFNFGDGFDEVPDIEVEGEIDTEGSLFD